MNIDRISLNYDALDAGKLVWLRLKTGTREHAHIPGVVYSAWYGKEPRVLVKAACGGVIRLMNVKRSEVIPAHMSWL